MMRLLLALALVAAPALAWAQYKCKDERGRWQYVNLPRPGCTDMSGKSVDPPKSAAPAPAAPKGRYASPFEPPAAKKAAAPKPAAKQQVTLNPLPADKAQRKVDCRGLKQQHDHLMSPEGRKVEMHAARVSQLERAMQGCR